MSCFSSYLCSAEERINDEHDVESRTAMLEDLLLFSFAIAKMGGRCWSKTFETSNELIMKMSRILAWEEWYAEGLEQGKVRGL